MKLYIKIPKIEAGKICVNKDVLMFLIGNSYSMDKFLIETIKKYERLKYYQFNYINHKKAINLMDIADVLVCFNPNSIICEIPSKVHEYSRFNKPTFFIMDGEPNDYLKTLFCPLFCKNDVISLNKGLLQLIQIINESHVKTIKQINKGFNYYRGKFIKI